MAQLNLHADLAFSHLESLLLHSLAPGIPHLILRRRQTGGQPLLEPF
jgi:hypothetical protein